MADEKTLDEKDLVSLVVERRKLGEHNNLDMQNYINLSYYIGQQWIGIDPTSKQLIVPQASSGEVRYTANKIQPIVRTEFSKLTKQKPICNVVPASSDDEDIQSAHVGNKVLEAMEFLVDLPEIDKELIMEGLCCSIGFVKPYWNPSKGVKLEEDLNEGDIDIDVINCFEFRYDPSARKWKDVGWCVQDKIRTIDYVEEVYGKKVAAEKGLTSSNIFDSKIQNISNLGAITYKSSNDSVIVSEYWEKPTTKYPKGRRITIANGVLLFFKDDISQAIEDDDSERELPYFPFTHINVPGRVAGQSIIENLIPVQRERNKSRSQIIKNGNLVSNPAWLCEEGALINDIEGDAGEIIEYAEGKQAPILSQPKSMGMDVYKNIEQCDEELFFISGQSESSHGMLPGNQKLSGIGLSILQEQDDTKLAPTTQTFERCKAKYMSYILKLVKCNYDMERTLKFVGKSNEVESITFKGSDLASTDVRVIAGSALPQSKAAKQEFVMGLVDRNILDPVSDKQQILNILELGFTDSLYDDYNLDVNHARGEQDKWLKNDFSPIVRDFYNHKAHIETHNRFRKSDDYEKLGDGQIIVDDHVQQHIDLFKAANLPVMPQEQQAPLM